MEHVFRHAGGELIDRPDLSCPTRGSTWRWIAVVWPDTSRADGWAALEWQPGERGWRMPATLMLGDVIEFGSVALDADGHALADTTRRWFGWLAELTPFAAIIVGPYVDAWQAAKAGRPLVDEIRCSQLQGPGMSGSLFDLRLRHDI
jgi:hypothetical protein